MYSVAAEFCANSILSYSRKKCLGWNDGEILSKAHDCATWLIEPYLRKPEFRINRLSSYAHFALLKILYGNKSYEQRNCSLDALIEEHGEKDLEDIFNDSETL